MTTFVKQPKTPFRPFKLPSKDTRFTKVVWSFFHFCVRKTYFGGDIRAKTFLFSKNKKCCSKAKRFRNRIEKQRNKKIQASVKMDLPVEKHFQKRSINGFRNFCILNICEGDKRFRDQKKPQNHELWSNTLLCKFVPRGG